MVKPQLDLGNCHEETVSEEVLRTDKVKASNSMKTTNTDNTPLKSNDIPKSVVLPLSNRSPNERRKADKSNDSTPQINNNSRKYTKSIAPENKDEVDVDHPNDNDKKDTDREAYLERQARLACALGSRDEDESSSILQLAQEVQRAAEDELSFY